MRRMTQAICEEIIGGMKLTCPCFGDTVVRVNHEDGTSLTFRHALAWHYAEYLLVATEHNGYHYFHKGDLADWGMYTSQEIAYLNEEGKPYRPYFCDECNKECKADEMTLADVPKDEINLCPTCLENFKIGILRF